MKNLFPTDSKSQQTGKSFAYVYNIIRTLRGPHGCPWDKEQSPDSLRSAILEEVYELIEAINNNDHENMNEESGDVLLIILLIMYIEEQEGSSSVDNMLQNLAAKLIHRHPHVFSDIVLKNSTEVIAQWKRIKVHEEGRQSPPLHVQKHLPIMERAYELQKEASKKGFDWKEYTEVTEKIHEELQEVEDVLSVIHRKQPDDPDLNDLVKNLEEEIGDLLFAVINLSRKVTIHPVHALMRTSHKFLKRFSYVAREMEKNQLEMHEDNIAEMEKFWQQSKRNEHSDKA